MFWVIWKIMKGRRNISVNGGPTVCVGGCYATWPCGTNMDNKKIYIP